MENWSFSVARIRWKVVILLVHSQEPLDILDPGARYQRAGFRLHILGLKNLFKCCKDNICYTYLELALPYSSKPFNVSIIEGGR